MRRPFRKYCIGLARTLGMTVNEMLSKMSSNEISEQMAYDLCSDTKQAEDINRKNRFKDYLDANPD